MLWLFESKKHSQNVLWLWNFWGSSLEVFGLKAHRAMAGRAFFVVAGDVFFRSDLLYLFFVQISVSTLFI